MSFSPGKHIVMVIATLASGGAERVLSLLANQWIQRGNCVTLILLGSSSSAHYPLHSAITIRELNLLGNSRSGWESMRSAAHRVLQLRSALQNARPDAVISFMDSTNVLTLIAARRLSCPVIVSERTDPTQHRISRGWRALRRLTYPRATRVVVQTSAVATWAKGFLPGKSIRVIPNPLSPVASGKQVTLPDLSDLPSRYIVAVGRLDPVKGFDLLLDAYVYVCSLQECPPLVIVGGGAEEKNLRDQINRLGLTDKVILTGNVPDPMPYLKNALIFAMTSRFEGFPNALIEAMSVGLPVVSFDCHSGPREIIRQEHNGLLVRAGDFETLAFALQRLINDGELRKKLGRNALQINDDLAIDRITDQWEEAITAAR